MNIVRRESAPVAAQVATEWNPFQMFRDLVRWDPFREMAPLLPREGEEMLYAVDVDVKETPEAYVFKADLPGIKEKDLEISLSQNRLTLRGKREAERREERTNYFACERSYGAFVRTFTLPHGANAETATAELKEGVLTINVPKSPEVQPRKIAVQPPIEKEKAKA